MSNLHANISSSDEHEELLAEMELIERLPTQERLKQARRRRALQLKKWFDNEKQYEKTSTNNTNNNTNNNNNNNNKNHRNNHRNNYKSAVKFNNNNNNKMRSESIRFQDHVVLLDAIMRRDVDEVHKILRQGVTPNSANEDGLTAIHQCCIDDSADLLRILIANGANLNVCDNDLWTPLHAAATCANLEICKILIANGADLLAVNTDGNMPYDICDDEVCLEYIETQMALAGVTQQAIDDKRSETEMRMLNDLKEMIKNSYKIAELNRKESQRRRASGGSECDDGNNYLIDLNSKDSNGATLMHIACANGYKTIIEYLLYDCVKLAENDKDLPIIPPSINVTDNDGWTPLHVATFWCNQKGIEILLENGADINARTNNDETVLELCDDADIREFIIQKNKEIESQEAARQAALQIKLQMQMRKNKMQLPLTELSNSSNSINMSSSTNSILKQSDRSNNTTITTSNNTINNSTRSLKRTSTGVNRRYSILF
jgi:protein phosphatase 1 regulatory subunit 16A